MERSACKVDRESGVGVCGTQDEHDGPVELFLPLDNKRLKAMNVQLETLA